MLNKNLEHRRLTNFQKDHQQNVALMRLGVQVKNPSLQNAHQTHWRSINPKATCTISTKYGSFLWPRIQFLQQRVMGNPPTPTIGGEVFSHTFTFAVRSLWTHGHQFPLHYIQRLKGPEFRNISKTSGFYGGDLVISSM